MCHEAPSPTLFMNPIVLTFIAFFCYGLSGPIAKLGYNRGMLTDGFLIPYGIGLILFSSVSLAQRGLGGIYPNPTALLFGLIAGGLCAIGFKTSGIALSTPGVSVSVIMMILTAHGLLASGVSIPLFREMNS